VTYVDAYCVEIRGGGKARILVPGPEGHWGNGNGRPSPPGLEYLMDDVSMTSIKVVGLSGDPNEDDASLAAIYRGDDESEQRVALKHEEWTQLKARENEFPYSFQIAEERLLQTA